MQTIARIIMSCGIVVGLSACQNPTLGRDDTLILAFEPSSIYPATSSTLPQSTDSDRDCQIQGGAVVRTIGALSDGTPAGGNAVNLWLSPAGGLTLVPISNSNTETETGRLTVHLDSSGTGASCLYPGTLPDSATVHAQSGVVAATAALNVLDRRIPSGGTLLLSVVPQTSDVQTSTQLTCGGVPSAACVPGMARRASVQVQGLAGAMGAVPEDALVTLSANLGWLTIESECGKGGNSQLNVPLKRGAGTASWCFGDAGGSATLNAQSGTVTATAALQVPALPATVLLSPGTATAKAGDALALTAVVLSCAGNGISGVPVLLSVPMGQLSLPSGPLMRTGTDGTVTVTGTVGIAPLKIGVRLPQAADPGCSIDIGARP